VAFPDITPELKAAMPELRGRLLANQSLAELTWFRVGGPAQVLFTPTDEDDLAYFLKHLPDKLPVYVVGVGSNLIVRDGGLPGVVIRLAPRGFGETATSSQPEPRRWTSAWPKPRRRRMLPASNSISAFPAASAARCA
jgi:UDP-N-acetylmuramate dehydrogenase